jgi:hypothetical protein
VALIDTDIQVELAPSKAEEEALERQVCVYIVKYDIYVELGMLTRRKYHRNSSVAALLQLVIALQLLPIETAGGGYIL